MQKPVPLSNQSLFLSSYTLTRFLSFGGGTTSAIVCCVRPSIVATSLSLPWKDFLSFPATASDRPKIFPRRCDAESSAEHATALAAVFLRAVKSKQLGISCAPRIVMLCSAHPAKRDAMMQEVMVLAFALGFRGIDS